jgi:Family of unknown function (DUF6011)
MRCWHCKGSHETVAQVRTCAGKKGGNTPTGATNTYEFLSMGQQKYLGDLLRQLHLELAGDVTLETVSYQTGKTILDGLVDARRNKAVGKPMVLPAGVTMLANPPSARATRTMTQQPLPDVPAGHYAIPSLTGNNDLDFFRVNKPKKGTWAGRVFVDRVIGGKPDVSVRGKTARKVLEAILDFGIEDAGILYGTQLGQCRKCNRHLTDELSRMLGIGPECRSRES